MSGRKKEIVRTPANFERDAGKMFLITEWPAAKSERWGLDMFLVLKGTSGEVPPEVMSLGMVAVAWRGLNTFLAADVDPKRLHPLLDEMLTCVQMIRDPKNIEVATDIVSDDDIEEVKTRIWLRSEVLRIHTGFSAADAMSAFLQLIQNPTSNSSNA